MKTMKKRTEINELINLDKRKFKISGDYIQDVLTDYTFKIQSIKKEGIVIETLADNGAQIDKTISWLNINR